MRRSAAEPGAGPVDKTVGVLPEIERDVLVREPAELIPTHAVGSEPLRGAFSRSRALSTSAALG